MPRTFLWENTWIEECLAALERRVSAQLTSSTTTAENATWTVSAPGQVHAGHS